MPNWMITICGSQRTQNTATDKGNQHGQRRKENRPKKKKKGMMKIFSAFFLLSILYVTFSIFSCYDDKIRTFISVPQFSFFCFSSHLFHILFLILFWMQRIILNFFISPIPIFIFYVFLRRWNKIKQKTEKKIEERKYIYNPVLVSNICFGFSFFFFSCRFKNIFLFNESDERKV